MQRSKNLLCFLSKFFRGIFGINMVPQDIQQIVITEGEIDALSVYEMTGIPSISLPNGITHLPDYLV